MDRARRLDSLIAALLLMGMTWIFLASPVQQAGDSRYSMLVSESLLHYRTFALDTHFTIKETLVRGEAGREPDLPYQLFWHDGHWYEYFPPGGPILSIPFVAVLNWFGVKTTDENRVHIDAQERQIQSIVASLVMAGFVVVVYVSARILLPLAPSVLVAVGSGLGTQVWSTATRSVWSHTWAVLLTSLIVLSLLQSEVGGKRLLRAWLASLLAWLYITRPTGAMVVIGVVIYVACYHREALVRLLVVGGFWLSVFVAYSWTVFEQPLPRYFLLAQEMSPRTFWMGLAGNLISPSRGLFVYVPVSVVVLCLVVRNWRSLPARRLAVLAIVCSMAHLLAVSSFPKWWGGHSYGARYTTCLVPWFSLLAILGLAVGRAESKATPARVSGRIAWPIWAATLLLSIVLNGLGAVSLEGWRWNPLPENVDAKPQRVWEWRHAQFLAAFAWPLPWDYPDLSRGVRVGAAETSDARHFWGGWSETRVVRWTTLGLASLIFRWRGDPADRLVMHVRPFLVTGKLRSQKIRVLLNDRWIGEIVLRQANPTVVSLSIPSSLIRERNMLQFRLPKAGDSRDLLPEKPAERLGVAVTWSVLE